MDQQLITRIVEAALLAANQPLTLVQLHGLFPLDQPAPDDSVARALEILQQGCAERGVELVEVASGFRYQVKHDVHEWVARLWTERQTRYTRATLETLALIAYRQPITRGEIEQVRGVAVNSNIIRALEEREWVRVVGHRDVPGKPELLATTKTFLDYFGLKRLDELPPLSELKDIGELEPQFQFDGDDAIGKSIKDDDTDSTGDGMPVGDISLADDTDTAADQSNQDAGEDDTQPFPEAANEAFANEDHVDAGFVDQDSAGDDLPGEELGDEDVSDEVVADEELASEELASEEPPTAQDSTPGDTDTLAMPQNPRHDDHDTSNNHTDDDAIAASSEQKDE